MCSLLLAPLYALISNLITIEDGFLYILVSIIPIMCLYCIPFWISLLYLKKYRVTGIGSYILWDATVCFAPAAFGTLFYEIAVSVIHGRSVSDGFVTVIFTTIFLIIAFGFWVLYYLFSYKKNRS